MIAHISEDGCNRIQTVVEHTEGVYELCAKKAQKIHIANIARLCAIFHDIGKEKQRFQDYILADEIQQKSLKGKIEHSSAGAKYIYDHYHGRKNYKMKCERYLNESAFRTFFCFKQ